MSIRKGDSSTIEELIEKFRLINKRFISMLTPEYWVRTIQLEQFDFLNVQQKIAFETTMQSCKHFLVNGFMMYSIDNLEEIMKAISKHDTLNFYANDILLTLSEKGFPVYIAEEILRTTLIHFGAVDKYGSAIYVNQAVKDTLGLALPAILGVKIEELEEEGHLIEKIIKQLKHLNFSPYFLNWVTINNDKIASIVVPSPIGDNKLGVTYGTILPIERILALFIDDVGVHMFAEELTRLKNYQVIIEKFLSINAIDFNRQDATPETICPLMADLAGGNQCFFYQSSPKNLSILNNENGQWVPITGSMKNDVSELMNNFSQDNDLLTIQQSEDSLISTISFLNNSEAIQSSYVVPMIVNSEVVGFFGVTSDKQALFEALNPKSVMNMMTIAANKICELSRNAP